MGTWQIKKLTAFTKILLSFLNKQIVTCPWLISQVLQKLIFDNFCKHFCCFYLGVDLGVSFTFHLYALEKEMATHSSVLAWRIPGTGEPGGLPSMGSHRVGHD